MARFAIGEVVRTMPDAPLQGEGPIHEIILPTGDLALLWGDSEPHYLIRDNQSGEFISVIERGLERV